MLLRPPLRRHAQRQRVDRSFCGAVRVSVVGLLPDHRRNIHDCAAIACRHAPSELDDADVRAAMTGHHDAVPVCDGQRLGSIARLEDRGGIHESIHCACRVLDDGCGPRDGLLVQHVDVRRNALAFARNAGRCLCVDVRDGEPPATVMEDLRRSGSDAVAAPHNDGQAPAPFRCAHVDDRLLLASNARPVHQLIWILALRATSPKSL